MNISWHNFDVAEPESTASVDRIIAASQQEILNNGILGFRTMNVAKLAQCNISMIYRHFKNRDDLIVQTLGLMFNKLQHEYVDECNKQLEQTSIVTPDLLIKLVPNLDEIEKSQNGRMWLLAVALSTESEELKNAIATTITELIPKWTTFFETLGRKLGSLDSLDLRVYQILLKMNFLYYNSLFREHRISDDQYKEYLTELLIRPTSSTGRSTHRFVNER